MLESCLSSQELWISASLSMCRACHISKWLCVLFIVHLLHKLRTCESKDLHWSTYSSHLYPFPSGTLHFRKTTNFSVRWRWPRCLWSVQNSCRTAHRFEQTNHVKAKLEIWWCIIPINSILDIRYTNSALSNPKRTSNLDKVGHEATPIPPRPDVKCICFKTLGDHRLQRWTRFAAALPLQKTAAWRRCAHTYTISISCNKPSYNIRL